MPTNTNVAFPSARRDPGRQVDNTLRFTISWNDVGQGAQEVLANSLPAGAFITGVNVSVLVAFNAGTTNVLTVGQNSATFNDIVASGDVNLAVVANTAVARGVGLAALLNSLVDKPVNAKYAQTGTPATQGQAVICITFEGGWAS